MTPTELFRAGRLAEAVAAQIEEVKAHPADQGKRLFLFELAAFSGDLERARRQIDLLKYDDPKLDAATASYRALIDAEAARRAFFIEGVPPLLFGEAPDHVRLRIDAVLALKGGQNADAARLLAEADELTPPVNGTINGKPVESLRDADDLFSGVLEVFAHGKYYWVALDQVTAVMMKAPEFPRDLLFIPARLEMAEEAGDVFLPTLYPGSFGHPDDQVKLGRATDWAPRGDDGPTLGVGLHTYLVNDDAMSLLEWREFRAAENDDEADGPTTPPGE
jgi:type VI secretion system protein ImpE